ncbi:hypothetical protein B0O99DRAFT_732785 [Bisporella sp. PMI_857]|nr:hypothetical protein B0O99DRAFT_732785 [Bisporella sp. PMI_857]
MANEQPMDKRRRQNRDSQRRFRERNKTRHSWNIPSAKQIGPLITSAAPPVSHSSIASSEHATLYISSDRPSLLSSESLPQASNEWMGAREIPTATTREDAFYRQTQHYNSPSSVRQMSLPLFGTQFSLDELSMPNTNKDTSYHQQQDFGNIRQAVESDKDVVFSPVSLDANLWTDMEPRRPTRPEVFQPHKRTPVSRAEQMISDVESLYEFGVSLSIFPEDPSLRNALKRMKERFRSLVKTEVPSDQRSVVDDMHEGFSQDSDSDE